MSTEEEQPLEEQQPEEENQAEQEYSEEPTNESGFSLADPFGPHGGDPRDLDLGKSLLVAKLPSSFLNDTFDVFSECVHELLSEEFKITREAVERIIRIPKLQNDAENAENALRAIVMFKSRVHKHRVIAQKKLATLDSTLLVEPIEEIPSEMLEMDDVEVADEVGDDDNTHEVEDDHVQLDDEEEEPKQERFDIKQDKTEESKARASEKKPEVKKENKKETKTMEPKKEIKEAKPEKKDDKEKKKEERPKKAYIDDDLKAPFEISWDGAPEFQWKICAQPGDSRRLTLENLFYSDLRNPFIYRVMIKAENVDINFPMRFNLQGNKQMYGKMVVTFQYAAEIMQEAVRHLIFVRCPEGRRIKVYLPQTPQAVKQKDELEEKLGRIIKPTPRMHQLIIKVLPKEEYTIDDVKSWFPESVDEIIKWEQIEDEIGQLVGLVTFATAEAVVLAHSSHTFLNIATSTDRTAKVGVYMRGVEAHFGSLLTRWDQKKAREFYGEPPKVTVAKRPAIADSRSSIPAKRGRGSTSTSRGPRGGGRGGYAPSSTRSRGGYSSSSYRDSHPPPFSSFRDDSYRRTEDRGWRTDYSTPQSQRDVPSRFSMPTSSYGDSTRREPYNSSGYSRR